MGGTQGKLKVASSPPPPGTALDTSSMSRKLRLKKFFQVATDLQDVAPIARDHPVIVNDDNPSNHHDSGMGTMASTKSAKSSKSSKKKEKKKKKNMETYITSLLPTRHDICDANPGSSNGTRSLNSKPKLVKEHFDTRVTAKYDVKALIGKGSFSRVVRAEHRGSAQLYAIKLIPAKNGTGAFENELSILSRVQHAHIIRLHEVIRTQNRVYMVMQLATGGELYDAIVSKGRFTEQETATAMNHALDGLIYLHKLGITHRDLKPENLLYTNLSATETRLLITDFGLANQRQPTDLDDNHMTDTCGTPEYIAPEVLLRFPYSTKVDLWAIGVITYILLSGIMPFDDESRTRLYRQIIRGKYVFFPQFWNHVSGSARQFVRELLVTDPDERLCAEEAYNHSWIATTLGLHTRCQGVKARLAVEEDTRSSFKGSSVSDGRRSPPAVDSPPMSPTRAATKQRTRSNRSIRSVARSDHGHRIDPREVERLSRDPEIRKIVFDKTRRSGSIMTAPGGYGVGSRSDVGGYSSSGRHGRAWIIGPLRPTVNPMQSSKHYPNSHFNPNNMNGHTKTNYGIV